MTTKKSTPKRPSHRPPKITPEKVQAAIRAARAGAWYETIAAHIGVSASTFREWRRRGERERDRLASSPRFKPKAKEALYLELSGGLLKALADWELEQQATVMQFARGVELRKEKTIIKIERRQREDGSFEDVEIERTTHRETRVERSWQAAQTGLERRYPARHGRRLELEASLSGEVVLGFEGEGDDEASDWLKEDGE